MRPESSLNPVGSGGKGFLLGGPDMWNTFSSTIASALPCTGAALVLMPDPLIALSTLLISKTEFALLIFKS